MQREIDWNDLTKDEPKGWRARYLHSCRVRKGNKGEDKWSVVWDETGILCLKNHLLNGSIGWADVIYIVAQQKAAITIDLLFLSFYDNADERSKIAICDLDKGFEGLVDEVERRYPVAPEDWRTEVDGVPGTERIMAIWQSGDAPSFSRHSPI